jgi:hypothetical protein
MRSARRQSEIQCHDPLAWSSALRLVPPHSALIGIGRASMSSEHQHVEVLVVLLPGADARVVAQVLARHGLQVAPIKAGLLASGEATAVSAAFGGGRLDSLCIPDPLRELVESVAVVPRKDFGSRYGSTR